MKRSIITSIEFSSGYISIHVLENLNANVIEIFNAQGSIKKANDFLKKNIAIIEEKINGKLSDVNIIVEPSKSINSKIEITKVKHIVANGIINKINIENLYTQARKQIQSKDNEVVFVQSLQYEVTDALSKKYFNAPIGRKGKNISALFAVTTLPSTSVYFIKSVVNIHGLNINKILLKPQTMSQNNISAVALKNGSILMHFEKTHSYLTVNKYGATVAMKFFSEYGLNKLVKGISQILGCTEDNAKKLLTVHGSTKISKQNRVIHTYIEGIKQVNIRENDLNKIIIIFINKLSLLVRKFIKERKLEILPVIISGQLNNLDGIDELVKNNINTNVTIYSPMTYVEMNYENRSTNGLVHLNEHLLKVSGEHLLSIVETNPNNFSTISAKLNTSKKGLWIKIFNKLGGIYERN